MMIIISPTSTESELLNNVAKQHVANQHFNLIAGMLDLRQWEMARKSCSRYIALGLDSAADHPAILASSLRLLNEMIEPLYRTISLEPLGITTGSSTNGKSCVNVVTLSPDYTAAAPQHLNKATAYLSWNFE
jgi:hypothetical protein